MWENWNHRRRRVFCVCAPLYIIVVDDDDDDNDWDVKNVLLSVIEMLRCKLMWKLRLRRTRSSNSVVEGDKEIGGVIRSCVRARRRLWKIVYMHLFIVSTLMTRVKRWWSVYATRFSSLFSKLTPSLANTKKNYLVHSRYSYWLVYRLYWMLSSW